MEAEKSIRGPYEASTYKSDPVIYAESSEAEATNAFYSVITVFAASSILRLAADL